jgi:hypothetical protein
MSSLVWVAIVSCCVVGVVAMAFHYALEAEACLRVIRKKQSLVREAELDEWLMVVACAIVFPILLSTGFHNLTSSLMYAACQLGVGLLMLGYVVKAGRRRWFSAPCLCLYGYAGEVVREHVRRGMAMEVAAMQSGQLNAGRKSDESQPDFPGLEFADTGFGVTLVRGLGDWRGRAALKDALLKRVIQTNLACDQQLKLDIQGIRLSVAIATSSVLVCLGVTVWIILFAKSLP